MVFCRRRSRMTAARCSGPDAAPGTSRSTARPSELRCRRHRRPRPLQAVDTAEAHAAGHRSRLVVEAAHRAADRYGADRLVIAADPDYHALGLYESLGFQRQELVSGVCRRPD
jgi:hypothetical protein